MINTRKNSVSYKNNIWPPHYPCCNPPSSPRAANRDAGFFMSQVRRWESMSCPSMISPLFRTLLSPLLTWLKLNLKESPKYSRRDAAPSTPPGRTASKSTTSPVLKPNRWSRKQAWNFSSWGSPSRRKRRWGPALSQPGRFNRRWRTPPKTWRNKPKRKTPASASETPSFFLSLST